MEEYYIYYGDSNQEKTAIATEKQLLQSSPDAIIHLIPVSSSQQFYNEWSSMGIDESGNTVTISGVFIMLHGESEYIVSPNGGADIYIDQLDKKTIDTIMLTACNTGNVNYANNVATQLAMSQDVNQVIAPDGYGYLIAPGYASSEYGADYDSIERAGNGFLIFQNINGTTEITYGLSKNRVADSVINLYRKGTIMATVPRCIAAIQSVISEAMSGLKNLLK